MIPVRAGPCRFGLFFLLVAVLATSGLGGCAATPTARVNATGGVRLSMLMVDARGGAAARYEVRQDGTLGFSGGLDAHFDRITWTGPMTDEEIEVLLDLMEEHQWFERSPLGSSEPEGLTYRIDLSGPEGRKRFRISGRAETVTAVESLLDRIARRRFEPILDTLPKSGDRN